MLDRFNNPMAAPNNLPFDAPFGRFQGGDLPGRDDRLGYIKGLGAGAIWLSPVIKNRASDPTTYHGYGIQNFLAAEPRFASDPANADDELRALVDAAHAQGLYVIFDIVLHHAAMCSPTRRRTARGGRSRRRPSGSSPRRRPFTGVMPRGRRTRPGPRPPPPRPRTPPYGLGIA